ncbi:MAG: hypothetical protein CMJ16_00725 [Peredibacter sp.]|nr:hypothetical protein [Peredibacter sp.]|tara:strand:+ start:341 stop:1507 length:1167 start_codon:yes stop_codon:yes gene_type:complete
MSLRKLKILHLATDEKFINTAYETFERNFPEQNEVLVYTTCQIKFATNSKFQKVSLLRFFNPTFRNRLLKGSYDLIILHSLCPQWGSLAKHFRAPVSWLGWGFDYYDLIYSDPQEMLLPESQLIAAKLYNSKMLKVALKELLKKNLFRFNKEESLKYFSSFSPVLKEDYELLKKNNFSLKLPKFASWNYGTLEGYFLKHVDGKKITGKNILLGNSATIENNHLDAFNFLSNLNFQDDLKIVVPLSYGDSKYGELVEEVGRERLGKNFFPLKDFMDLEDYTKLIQSCDTVIMNHVRQQALGNIIVSMYLGAKIFLREECPTYKFFISQGAHIFSIQELEAGRQNFNVSLRDDQVETNRQILKKHWSKSIIDEKTKLLVKTTKNEFKDEP